MGLLGGGFNNRDGQNGVGVVYRDIQDVQDGLRMTFSRWQTPRLPVYLISSALDTDIRWWRHLSAN